MFRWPRRNGRLRSFRAKKSGGKFPRFHQLHPGDYFFFKRGDRQRQVQKMPLEQLGSRVVNARYRGEMIFVGDNTPTTPRGKERENYRPNW